MLKRLRPSNFKKRKKKKPLMGTNKDIRLLHQVHGRRFPKFKQVKNVKKVLSPKEKTLFRIAFWVLVIAAVWFGISLISTYRTTVPAIGGRYVEAVVGTPEHVNPVFSSVNDVDQDLTRLVFSGLMRYDAEQRLLPDLAASYEISDDKKTYTFKLREDVKWHDGEPFTARDIVYTYETIQDETVGSPLFVSFQGVSINQTDDYTVSFTLKEPFAPFLSSLTTGILPEHIWFDVGSERMRLAKENTQPIGTGPYLFKKLTKDEAGNIFTYELGRYAEYHREAAFIEEFVFQFYPAFDTDIGAIAALRAKQVDGLHFVPSDLREKVVRKHIMLHTLQLPQYTSLFFNQDRQPALQDKDVRTALAYSLDKDRILREAINDEGHVIYSPVLPGYPGYNPEIERTPFSVSQANELLDKSWSRISADEYREMRRKELREQFELPAEGEETTEDSTTDEGDTTEETTEDDTSIAEKEVEIEQILDQELNVAQTFYRKNKDDEILEVNVVTAETKEYQNTANLVLSFWQEIGVKVNVSFVSSRDISKSALKDRSYDVLLYGAIIGSDPDQYPFWHSSQAEFPGLNLSKYVNRNADALLESARESSDENEVVESYQKFQDILLGDMPAIFLYTPTYTYATTNDVKNITATRIFSPADRFADVTSWYVKTKGDWGRK